MLFKKCVKGNYFERRDLIRKLEPLQQSNWDPTSLLCIPQILNCPAADCSALAFHFELAVG